MDIVSHFLCYDLNMEDVGTEKSKLLQSSNIKQGVCLDKKGHLTKERGCLAENRDYLARKNGSACPKKGTYLGTCDTPCV